jgi:hypothetical protein
MLKTPRGIYHQVYASLLSVNPELTLNEFSGGLERS